MGEIVGSCSGTCSYTYTVYDVNNNFLESNALPSKDRLDNVKYSTLGSGTGTTGLGEFNSLGIFNLVEVFDEKPETQSLQVVTDVVCNGDGTITVTKQDVTVLKCE